MEYTRIQEEPTTFQIILIGSNHATFVKGPIENHQ